jgi:uncharacterized protein YhbP (UPF0306 family)
MALTLPPDVADFLAQQHVMTLATQGLDGPWAAALFYAHDGDDLIFLSSPDSRHIRNLSRQAQCAATIQGDQADWRAIQGIQIEGIARETTGDEISLAQSCYGMRFPFVQPGLAPAAIAQALERVRWYRLQMTRLYFIDNLRGLGKRQQFDA